MRVALHLEFAKALKMGTERPLTLAEWHRKREPVQWKLLQRIEGAEVPALVRAGITLQPIDSQRETRWYRVEAQAVYEVISQRDWGQRRTVERWHIQCALPLGVPVDSGVHWEWWDFGQDWDYWFDRDYFINVIIVRGRLQAPTLGKWQTIRIPIQLSFG
jgi:hypothetical protein